MLNVWAAFIILVAGNLPGSALANSDLVATKLCDDGRLTWVVIPTLEDARAASGCDISIEIIGEITATPANGFERLTEASRYPPALPGRVPASLACVDARS